MEINFPQTQHKPNNAHTDTIDIISGNTTATTYNLPSGIEIDITSATTTVYTHPSDIDLTEVNKSTNIFDLNRVKDIHTFIGYIIYMATCPISWKFIKDPYLSPNNNWYDKDHIEKWLSEKGNSPLTRQPRLKTSLAKDSTVEKLVNVVRA